MVLATFVVECRDHRRFPIHRDNVFEKGMGTTSQPRNWAKMNV